MEHLKLIGDCGGNWRGGLEEEDKIWCGKKVLEQQQKEQRQQSRMCGSSFGRKSRRETQFQKIWKTVKPCIYCEKWYDSAEERTRWRDCAACKVNTGGNVDLVAFFAKDRIPLQSSNESVQLFSFSFLVLSFFPNIVFKATLLFVNLKNDGWRFKIIFTIHWLVAGRVAAALLTWHGWLAGRPRAGLWLVPISDLICLLNPNMQGRNKPKKQ